MLFQKGKPSLFFAGLVELFAHFHRNGGAVKFQPAGHGLDNTGKVVVVQIHNLAVQAAFGNDFIALFQGLGKLLFVLLPFDLRADHKKIRHSKNQEHGEKLL